MDSKLGFRGFGNGLFGSNEMNILLVGSLEVYLSENSN